LSGKTTFLNFSFWRCYHIWYHFSYLSRGFFWNWFIAWHRLFPFALTIWRHVLTYAVRKICQQVDTRQAGRHCSFQISAVLQSSSRATINHRAAAVSHTNENTKELLLDKLHVSHNESGQIQWRFAFSQIMNFADLFHWLSCVLIEKTSHSILCQFLLQQKWENNYCQRQRNYFSTLT